MSFFYAWNASNDNRLIMGDKMGYKIVYGKKKRRQYHPLRLQTVVAAFIFLLVLCVCASWPEGTAQLRRVFVSEELSESAQAMIAMVEDLKAGDDISDAIMVFCQELIHGS